jgi:tetrahydromethanopterin S-methyltransferase subunit C
MNTYEQNRGNGSGLGERIRGSRQEAREIGSEVADIAADLRVLATKEAELARAEIREGVQAYGRGAGFGAAAGIFAWLALLFACLGLMFGLDEVLPLWAAALITALILLVVTAILALVARSSFQQGSLVPNKAMNSVREDIKWARAQMNLNAK